MRIATHWQEYSLLDCTRGERLEQWGEFVLIRPDPQVIWQEPARHPLWQQAHARYARSPKGGGEWQLLRPMPDEWQISYGALRFGLKRMGFKHTGLFPEQAVNWEFLDTYIRQAASPLRVLNLFAYTGGATLACLAAGAHVTHVDAARGMVQRARQNAALSGLDQSPQRWIVEDCQAFVQRELRRGHCYDIVLLDPPSYGRGPGGETWQLSQELHKLLQLCGQLLAPTQALLVLNSYSAEFSPGVMQYLLSQTLGGQVQCEEIALPVQHTGLALPCGCTAICQR